MKKFNAERFCQDIITLRGTESQQKFAEKLSINRSTLSLLETGKQIPTLDIFNRSCALLEMSRDEYFVDSSNDSMVYLMGSLDEVDKSKMAEAAQVFADFEAGSIKRKNGQHSVLPENLYFTATALIHQVQCCRTALFLNRRPGRISRSGYPQ